MSNQGKKWWSWILALVLIINSGTLGFFWLNHFRERRAIMGGAEIKDYITDALKFNSKQKERFQVLVKYHQDQSARMRNDIALAKVQYYRFDVSQAQQLNALHNLKDAYGKLDSLNLLHFEEIRNLCSSDQLPFFDQMLSNILNRSNFGFDGPKGKN